jgi:UDP-N-acetylglucosamine 4,6-dehydratase (inverting)
MFKNKRILITGGTGSFGKAFLKYLIKNYKGFKKIIIFSRDELKQFEMSNYFSENRFPFIRYFLGDIRDLQRLNRAMEEVDYVIHAAALKQVPAAEYNPFEVIKTNVIGAQNIIEACLNSEVKKVIALSTDKAVAPINLYGATKLCADKLFISANNITGKKNLSFSVVRYGNVMGTRGSVIPQFLEQKKNGILHITDRKMTRFNITMNDSINLVLWALKNSVGGEIFVPKIPSYRILDLAKAIAPNAKINIIGLRPGEKIHEDLIIATESEYTVALNKYYAILTFLTTNTNNMLGNKLFHTYLKLKKNRKVKSGFSYRSDTNSDFLTIKEIKKLINKSKIEF